MQIYITNRDFLAENVSDYEEQKSIHKALFMSFLKSLSRKEKIDTDFYIEIDEHSFVFSHMFGDILFFEYKGAVL